MPIVLQWIRRWNKRCCLLQGCVGNVFLSYLERYLITFQQRKRGCKHKRVTSIVHIKAHSCHKYALEMIPTNQNYRLRRHFSFRHSTYILFIFALKCLVHLIHKINKIEVFDWSMSYNRKRNKTKKKY